MARHKKDVENTKNQLIKAEAAIAEYEQEIKEHIVIYIS